MQGHLRGFRRAGAGAEIASVMLLLLAILVPFLTKNVLADSMIKQALIGINAAFSVYIMLRMNLLSFATPAFMALGGYTVAILSMRGVTDVFLLTALAFAVPALVAWPLGAMVLRLRGTYFVLVTFVLTEILQLLLFETPGLTGGSNGISGIPAATLFGTEIGTNQDVFVLIAVLTLLAGLITAAMTRLFRQHFAAIEENEILAETLGLSLWTYKSAGFVVAAGVAGLAGFSLVTMLLTAHPTSFSSSTSVDTIAYTIIGGRGSMLGPVVGSALLVSASNLLGSQGQYAQGLYGMLIIAVVMVAKGGIVGSIAALARRLGAR